MAKIAGFGKAFVKQSTTKERLAGLTTRDRLAGLTTKERLAGLSAKERLAGLSAKERVAGLPARELRKLAQTQECIKTIQSLPVAVRRRITGTQASSGC